jgi:hypothetical protein
MVDYIQSFRPAYSLDDIRAAADQHRVRYEGRKVSSDIRNLGYTLEEVAHCISGLQTKHFQKSLKYENACYDAYIRDFRRGEDQPTDQIYIKLRLLGTGQLEIGIGSFHL